MKSRVFSLVAITCVIAFATGPSAMAAPPANDNFAGGTLISGAHVTRLADTSNGASAEPGEPSIAGCGICGSIWYTWTPSLSGPVTISTAGSNFDTVLGVYTGAVVSSLTTIVSNDDDAGTPFLTSRVHFDAIGATTYHIAVAGYGGDTGSVNLHLYEGPTSTTRVSLTDSSTQIPSCGSCNSYNESYDDNGVGGGNSVISSDGSHIVFVNDSSSVVTGDSGGLDDIFVRNTLANTTMRASTDTTNTSPNDISYDPSISGDGNRVAFTSDSTDLVASDTGGFGDIFVRDMSLVPPAAGAMTRISVDTGGGSSNDWSQDPSISSDGNVVAFESWATDISTTPVPTGARVQLFVRNVAGPTTTMASVQTLTTNQGTGGGSFDPSLDADGGIVAFDSSATNLLGVGVDTNGARDVFTHNMSTGVTSRISVDSTGVQLTGSSYNPSISADGTKIAFQSDASNAIATDTNGRTDVFVRDVTAGTTTRVSVRANGIQSIQGKGNSYDPVISPDGRYVIFTSDAANLVTGDTNGTADIFLNDLLTNVTSRLSVQTGGDEGTGDSSYPGVSANGVATWTYTGVDFAANDTNGRDDIYTRTIGFQADELLKGPADTTYAGDGVYQTTASGVQAKIVKAAKGSKQTFSIQVQNDGSVSDAFKVLGCAKKTGFGVKYSQGLTNLTTLVTTGTYSTGAIAPDATQTITLAIKLSKTASGSISCPITVTSASDITKVDQVNVTVKALA